MFALIRCQISSLGTAPYNTNCVTSGPALCTPQTSCTPVLPPSTATDPVAIVPAGAQAAALNTVLAGIGAQNTANFTFSNTCFYHSAYFDANDAAIPPTATAFPSSFSAYYLPRSFAANNIVPELCHPYRDQTFSAQWLIPPSANARGSFGPSLYGRYSLVRQTTDAVTGVCCTNTGLIEIMYGGDVMLMFVIIISWLGIYLPLGTI